MRHPRLGLRRQGIVGRCSQTEWDAACALSAVPRQRSSFYFAAQFRDAPTTSSVATFRRVVCILLGIGRNLFDARWPSSQISTKVSECGHADSRCGCAFIGAACPSPEEEEMVMRLSSSLVAPSAAAVLATVLLCGPAVSQPTTEPVPALPGISVERVARPPHKPAPVANLTRPVSFVVLAPTTLPDSIQGKLATLEKASSSCNGGCETSFKSGNAPWVGCSQTGPEATNLSATCTDTLTYKDYADCHDTKSFLGWDKNKVWWHCTSLLSGGKFQVAELGRSRHPR